MALELSPALVAGIVVVVFVSGVVNGVAGFGFALVGTMALATAVDPATAVVFIILPLLAVNLALARDLSPAELQTCGRRFAPLILATLAGTLVGMAALDVLPADPLRGALGVVTLAFVLSVQQVVTIPGLDRAKEGCFVESTPAMVGVGAVSGLLFGGTNVGVQLVAYVKSCDLSHSLFVGVVALVFVGINAVRVGAAGLLGLYPDLPLFGTSVAAIVPAVAGVAAGKGVRDRIAERTRRVAVLGLLVIIGLRLLLGGAGIL